MIEQGKSVIARKVTIHTLFIIFAFLCVTPFIIIVSISLSSGDDVYKYGYSLFPRRIDFTAYRYIFANGRQIVNSYGISIFVTVVGTVVSVLIMSLTAYALARKNFKYKRILSFYIFFTMLFSGGLVPTYILISQYLKLTDTIWVLIIPGLVNAYHIIMLRTFFQQTPDSLFESAKLDGASEFTILFRIAMPLAKPALATVAFLGTMGRWNDWFTALLYIRQDKLLPLQYLLYRIMAQIQFLVDNLDAMPDGLTTAADIPMENARMAMCIVAAGPMLLIFPFFQKYFVKGMTVGSIKG